MDIGVGFDSYYVFNLEYSIVHSLVIGYGLPWCYSGGLD